MSDSQDSDTVFKNQAQGTTEAPKGQFVNDLLRTEFHKRFIKRFVAVRRSCLLARLTAQ